MQNGWFTHMATGEKLYRFVPEGEEVKGFKRGQKVMVANWPSWSPGVNQEEHHPWTIVRMEERANGDLIITAHSDRYISDSTYGWTTLHSGGFRILEQVA